MKHTIYTMDLDRMSRMLETGRMRLVLRRGWIPKFMLKRAFNKFMTEFEEMFSASDKDFRNDMVRVMMWNKIKNILPMMNQLLVTDENEYANELFEHYFGRKWQGMEDSKFLAKEIQRLSKRYKEMFRRKAPEHEGVRFEQVIMSVEAVLDMHIPRTMKLYQFKDYNDQAAKRVQELNTRHGKH